MSVKFDFVPTKEQCDLIVEKNNAFYRTEQVIDCVEVHIYNYRLASYTDFKDPIGDGKTEAFWLRGLTFTRHPGETEWKRYLMLPKFFNVGETIGWMPEDFEGKKIDSIQLKHDGSLISFVEINGEWRAKTKQKFDNEQAELANLLVKENPNNKPFNTPYRYKRWGINEMFEIVSPKNRVVVPYQETKLEQLQSIRDLGDSATIFPLWELKDLRVESVNDLLELAKTTTGIEGWIIMCDNKIAKIKTDWYRRLHGLKFSLMQNDLQIFIAVLTESLDDALWLIDAEMPELRAEVEEKAQKFRDFYNRKAEECQILAEEFHELSIRGLSKNPRKDFALKHSKNEVFGVVMTAMFGNGEKTMDELLTSFLLKKYNSDKAVKGIYQ